MASAARAYQHGATAPQLHERASRARVRVVVGRRRAGVSARAVAIFKMALAVCAVVAAVSLVRVQLTALATATTIDQQKLSAQVTELVSTNTNLELQKSEMLAPSALKDSASQLGMHQADSVETITVPEDVVAYNDDGSLSLSGSLERAASE